MNVNLNDPKYKDKLDVNAKNILSLINEYNIYRNYIGEFTIGTVFKSPIKEKDDHHSFGIYWSKKHQGRLFFNDLALGKSGDVFVLVKELYGLSYYHALVRIIFDFRLTDRFKIPKDIIVTAQKKKPKVIDIKNIPKPSEISIKIRIRNWENYDIAYWNKYGICKATLIKYRVFPIDYIFINNSIIKADKYAYAYYECKDGIDRYKIYQPFSKNLKWLSNFIEGTISGWNQMPDKGDKLIITSSNKDAMCIHDRGFNSIAPQTETYTFKPHIVAHLYSRFKDIYIYYDYDRAGIKAAYLNKRKYGFIPIFTKSVKLKDPSDFYEKKRFIRNINV